MNKPAILAAVLAATLAGAAQAQPMREDPYGDATVSRADAQARGAAEFDKLDANHDGFLTSDELSAAPGGGRRAEMMLRFADSNGDGKLSSDEFTAFQLQRFDRMDTNHDGQLTKAERDAAREAMRQRMQSMQGGMGGGGGMPGSGDGQ